MAHAAAGREGEGGRKGRGAPRRQTLQLSSKKYVSGAVDQQRFENTILFVPTIIVRTNSVSFRRPY